MEKRIFKINTSELLSVDEAKESLKKLMKGYKNQPMILTEGDDISHESLYKVYLKLVEMHFNLQDPVPTTLEDASKDMDGVLKRLEELLKINKDETPK